ncbi:hypothetical protein C1E24_19455 [Pseudoalteromonas phenolica]|uniref:Lipoprotein n=1 Tax=Pseudoalteromonas phenolica TaxID=161398 RepID=A0A5R9PXG0_9GAMM|nr:hypothetical protein [Pseudoalteromonas phenolica]TLX45335.1 hypothetical protein C1E24_19455 [Pseudoalteromonas phenolica]
MRKTLFSISMLGLLTGCFSDSDNNVESSLKQPEPVANVRLETVNTPDKAYYQPGQPIMIDYSISSQLLDTEHVGVTFMAIAKDKVDQLASHDEPEGYELGTHYIEKLSDGEHSFTAELMLPNEEIPSDDYVIAAYVDSAKSIENEANTEDNGSRDFSDNAASFAQITIDSTFYHDFALDTLTVGDGFAMFPDSGRRETESQNAPEHKRADIIGHFDASKFGHLINEALVTATVTVAGVEFDAHFWQEGENRYHDDMKIKFADHEQSHYFPYDIAVNGVLLDKLQQTYDKDADENTFELTFTIEDLSSAHQEANLDNNRMTITVPYSLYDHDQPDDSWLEEHNITNPLTSSVDTSSKSSSPNYAPVKDPQGLSGLVSTSDTLWAFEIFSNTYGDKSKVAIVPSFVSWVLLQSKNGGLAWATAGGSFDLYMFDHSLDLFSAGASGIANGADGTASYSMNVSLLGNSLIKESETVSALDESYGYDWEEEQKLFSTTFTIAIVPVSVSAGIKGSVGVNTDLKYEGLQFSIGGDVLTASLDAYATAGIDLLVASGGIGVDFLIISDTLSATAYVDISKALSDSEIGYGIDVSNHMKAIEGEFYLWVKYPGYKFCCSFPTKTATKTLYNTGALYDKTWQMINYSDSFKF